MNQSLNPLAVSLSEKFKNKGGLNELALFAGAFLSCLCGSEPVVAKSAFKYLGGGQ